MEQTVYNPQKGRLEPGAFDNQQVAVRPRHTA